ncbi:anthrone oxygenase family protein [Dyadobacter jiangsuensis]|uniref:Putative membrane protein n=1 Tax=Dyadobacter jiangsuensis TaxID=1591085 RepID=A0A2P8G0A1_9BACT|nr:anthrone oxygenase family protein [Dyadobacter jiangsuensis]PSL27403.1 putative membrane protein [Dyadobacter jiangsuensis]
MTTINLFLLSAALASGLIAGLFYTYSCSVNPGLGALSDANYLAAMQSINRAILNPVFFLSFMGTLLLLPLSTYQHFGMGTRFYLLLAATLVYVIGTFGVTIAGNVPLNDALDKMNLTGASANELAAHRLKFEAPWNRLHTIRTYASVVSFVLVLLACLTTPDNS